MRNLYSKLNVHPAASPEEIRVAIDTCSNASVRADAKAVLLNKVRRQTYDRLNALLTDIGNLRASLGLSYAENWQGEEAIEYIPTSEAKCSRYEEFVQKLEKLNQSARIVSFSNTTKNFILKLIVTLILIATVKFIVWFISAPPSKPQLPTSSTRSKPLTSLPSSSLSEDTKRRLRSKLDSLEDLIGMEPAGEKTAKRTAPPSKPQLPTPNTAPKPLPSLPTLLPPALAPPDSVRWSRKIGQVAKVYSTD